ncbi:FAD-dependent oxidoreductase [Candidatus Saccharibacteria bacterium]|nr:FAD-dependent oxidoreductase [Candidatus Saccharibacteria bacterium]
MNYFIRTAGPIDRFLDTITSYKLLLYFLQILLAWTIIGAGFGWLPFEWYQIFLSALLLTTVCWSAGWFFGRSLDIPRNAESDYITALILTLILSPGSSLSDFAILAAAGLLAVSSKYLIVLSRRHILNPAAFGAFGVGFLLDYFPSWWVGTSITTPLLLIGGLLILRKMKRFIMVGTFLGLYVVVFSVTVLSTSGDLVEGLRLGFTATPLLFFAFVMLTEPLTSPYALNKALPYAVLVGLLYSTTRLKLAPEEALLIGNLFAYALVRDKRIELIFLKKKKEAQGIYSYLFSLKKPFSFTPGQFMEWTLPLSKSDSRGNRRYLTVSSSPTEKSQMMMSVKLPDNPSSFKQRLNTFLPGDKIMVSHLSGNFVLPKDVSQKLAFIAGGVGITPFRSIVKYAVDSQIHKDSVLLYSSNSPQEFAFVDLFKKASAFGLRTFYTVSAKELSLADWGGPRGPINSAMIKQSMPDYSDRLFYVSGPYGFVQAVDIELGKLGVPSRQIKLDYFPGYG